MLNRIQVKSIVSAIVTSAALLTSGFTAAVSAQPYIVKDGQPQAQIVIAERPQRTTVLAARELRRGIRKITGAELPIVRQPADGVPVTIYVGESPYTEKLGITTEGLDYGAHRIVSGKEPQLRRSRCGVR